MYASLCICHFVLVYMSFHLIILPPVFSNTPDFTRFFPVNGIWGGLEIHKGLKYLRILDFI